MGLYKNKRKTADDYFQMMCRDIDGWKEEAAYQKEQAEYWEKQYNDLMNSQLSHSKNMVGTMLKGLLKTD